MVPAFYNPGLCPLMRWVMSIRTWLSWLSAHHSELRDILRPIACLP
jgi:hypothetical protein